MAFERLFNNEERLARKAANQRAHYRRNKQRVLEQIKTYRKTDRGKAVQAAANKRRRKTVEHREYHRLYCAKRYTDDSRYRLALNLRNRLNNAIKNHQKSGSAINDLGCSIQELRQHLESQFTDGMSWENYGEWHIDHIQPLSSFDLRDRDELRKACHYSNLQPLWAEDNLKKGNNYGT